ncbi:hypothetical protein [Shinella sumterensis]|uniref:Uncharacterized protein n=1 Tax=Shinella sumterensis TaxID=1967501 RepID=A0AA50CKJ9_9HYPH|nr:hypothetical protein [Shinella sumterensis]WLR96087.1 hypothetical protein Q9313_10065 [Shinella sumterensis]
MARRRATVLTPGGTIRENNDAPDLSAPAGRVVAAGKRVADICDATLALRRVGLLDDHTGNHPASTRPSR